MEAHIMTLATVILALLTGALAYFTWVLAREAKKTRKQNIEPTIVVTVEPFSLASFYGTLVIENVGKGVAYDVKITELSNATFKKENKSFQLKDLSFTQQSCIKSGQRIEYILGEFKNFPIQNFEFSCTARDIEGTIHTFKSATNTSDYEDREFYGIKTMHDLVNETKKIRESLGSVITGFRRINVDSHSGEDRNNERKRRAELIEQDKAQNENK